MSAMTVVALTVIRVNKVVSVARYHVNQTRMRCVIKLASTAVEVVRSVFDAFMGATTELRQFVAAVHRSDDGSDGRRKTDGDR